jgi:hypothetical protein
MDAMSKIRVYEWHKKLKGELESTENAEHFIHTLNARATNTLLSSVTVFNLTGE